MELCQEEHLPLAIRFVPRRERCHSVAQEIRMDMLTANAEAEKPAAQDATAIDGTEHSL